MAGTDRQRHTYTLVAIHRSGVTRLVRRDDGMLLRVTEYPADGPSGHRARQMTVVPETYLESVRGWQTWTVIEKTGPGELPL